MNEKINCLVLNTVDEDPQTIWEIISVIRVKMVRVSENEILKMVFSSLTFLIPNGFVNVYRGYGFCGEEELVNNFILTIDFIKGHQNDWKNKDYNGIDYRFYITDIGREMLTTKCKMEYFQ